MLKTLGMKTTQIRTMYFLLFLFMTFLTLLFGLMLGWTLQSQFINLMSSYFPTELPPPGYYPILITCLTVLICQFGFIYPHITKLITISPMRVLKDDISFDYGFIPVFLMGLTAFFLLLFGLVSVRDNPANFKYLWSSSSRHCSIYSEYSASSFKSIGSSMK